MHIISHEPITGFRTLSMEPVVNDRHLSSQMLVTTCANRSMQGQYPSANFRQNLPRCKNLNVLDMVVGEGN